jgi:hydroxymethylpyrimidine kinase/phosphomethylpyrimidine kinase/thiamine-phosphate diphosphorylase
MNSIKPIVWSVAGSDNSGGAGIQADNATFADFSVHAGNIVTAITAQNSQGVSAIHNISKLIFDRQWVSLGQEYPTKVIKLGMLGHSDVFAALVEKLAIFSGTVVCDPILESTSGGSLIKNKKDYIPLFHFVDILTPNQQEFADLFSSEFRTADELVKEALSIAKVFSLDLIITGGENSLLKTASDLCIIAGKAYWLHAEKLVCNNTHGTGCSFSSAIAACLASGLSLLDACVLAKSYLTQGLRENVQITAACGPFQHRGFPRHIADLPTLSHSADVFELKAPRINQALGLYPVVDTVEWLEKCLQCGVKTIQLRVKNASHEQLDSWIAQAAKLGRQYQARLFINDYWQLAIKHAAYGVHLGQEDLDDADIEAIYQAGLHLGISTHSWYEIARAHSFKPSYIAIGPIFPTTTKEMPFDPQGIAQLQQWVEFIGDAYPIVAIGGIDQANAKAVAATGVGSIAMVRAITEAENYPEAIARLQKIID